MASSVAFVSTIPPTLRNVVAMQRLTLQDVRKGGFPHPRSLANPWSPWLLYRQFKKLKAHPQRYCGFTEAGRLVAYLKCGPWTEADERPFVDDELSGGFSEQRGVFGLVVSDELFYSTQAKILDQLLQYAVRQSTHPVNIVIHEHDPVLPVARRLGFEPHGPVGEAAGAPGLKQQRYTRMATV